MPNSTSLSNPETEREVLKALYWSPEFLYQVDIVPGDFQRTDHRKIYQAMLKLFIDGTRPDYLALRDTDPEIKGTYLFTLLAEAFTSANIYYHTKKLKELADKRRYHIELLRLIGQVEEDDFLQQAEKTLIDLQEKRRKQTITVKDALLQINKDMLAASVADHVGIQTGFSRLNEHCVGLCKQHSWVLGAYTSYGKSTFLSQIVSDICLNGARVLIFSVEDSIKDKITRLMATKSDIPIRKIIRGRFDDYDGERLAEAIKAIKEHHLHVYDDCYTLDDMELMIKKHILQGGLDVVAIDFVQNILTAGESIYDRMSEVAIRLQRMAKKYDVCVFALSQISEGKEKGSINLRGAQELASAADIVLWIDRKPDTRAFDLIIRKNRPFGVTGRISMRFNETWTGIEEVGNG